MKPLNRLAIALMIGLGAALPAAAQLMPTPVLPPASAQFTPAPLPPPVASPPPPPTASALSPALMDPRIIQTPYGRTTAPSTAAQSMSPLDQQKLQSYRSNLTSQQRALENQGVS